MKKNHVLSLVSVFLLSMTLSSCGEQEMADKNSLFENFLLLFLDENGNFGASTRFAFPFDYGYGKNEGEDKEGIVYKIISELKLEYITTTHKTNRLNECTSFAYAEWGSNDYCFLMDTSFTQIECQYSINATLTHYDSCSEYSVSYEEGYNLYTKAMAIALAQQE